jgi:hypothetical protein
MQYCLAYIFQVGKTYIYHSQDKRLLVVQLVKKFPSYR